MSKVRLTGSNSGYVEIAAAADAGNLTFTMPTSGTALLGNTGNVFSGITTTGQLDINGSIDVSSTSVFNDDVTFTGASYNVTWDKSDNALEFVDNAKIGFGNANKATIHHSGSQLFLNNTIGNLYLRLNGENAVLARPNAGVSLYYDASEKLVTTSTGVTVTGICTATSFSGSGENLTRTTQLSHRNKVINGAMAISQRGTSFTNITGNSGSTYTLDRFKIQMNDLDQAVVTVSQDSSAPDGFAKSLKIQCTTTETSVESSEHARLIYDGEAFDFTDIGFGTSSAKKITVSFWVKSNLTGTWGMNFWRGDANRSNLRTYTINSANTWEHKVITLVEDTTGGGVNSDNGYGFRINWGLATGANYAQSHSLDTWHSFEQQYFYPYDARNTNLFSSTSNNFYITGVQLEVGQQATPFEHRSIGEELTRCYRYYQVIAPPVAEALISDTVDYDNTTYFTVDLHTPMRANPSLVVSNFSNAFRLYGTNPRNVSTLSHNTGSQNTSKMHLYANGGSSGAVGFARVFDAASNGGVYATIAAHSEL